MHLLTPPSAPAETAAAVCAALPCHWGAAAGHGRRGWAGRGCRGRGGRQQPDGGRLVVLKTGAGASRRQPAWAGPAWAGQLPTRPRAALV